MVLPISFASDDGEVGTTVALWPFGPRINAPDESRGPATDSTNTRFYATHGVSSGLRTPRAPSQDVGVDHRGGDVAVSRELRHGPDVMSALEQRRGKRGRSRVCRFQPPSPRRSPHAGRPFHADDGVPFSHRLVAGKTHCHRQSRAADATGARSVRADRP